MIITENVVNKRLVKNEPGLLHALERRVRELGIIQKVNQIATESLELDEVFGNCLEKVIELMAIEMAAIFLTDKQRGIIAAVHGSMPPKLLDKLRKLSTEDSITKRLLLSEAPLVIEDLYKYSQLADIFVKEEGVRSIAAVPLKSNGRIIGKLIIASHTLHEFSSRDIHLLDAFGEVLGPTLKNAELYHTLQESNRQLRVQNRELAKQQHRLVAKIKEIEATRQLKSEFIANVSHEFRTPLNVIIGFSELMLDDTAGTLNQKQRQFMEDILNSGYHLLGLINEVIDLSRIEPEKSELNMSDISLTHIEDSL